MLQAVMRPKACGFGIVTSTEASEQRPGISEIHRPTGEAILASASEQVSTLNEISRADP
jgi:hypothetical protein